MRIRYPEQNLFFVCVQNVPIDSVDSRCLSTEYKRKTPLVIVANPRGQVRRNSGGGSDFKADPDYIASIERRTPQVKTVVLVTCGSKKLSRAARARDLYAGRYFNACMDYAESMKPEAIFILSAKHCLLDPEKVIKPYDVTLSQMGEAGRRKWGRCVLAQLRERYDTRNIRFVILAGENYWKNIRGRLEHVELPLKGKGIGQQIQYLNRRGQ